MNSRGSSGPYMCLVRYGSLTQREIARRRRIAGRHGGSFIYATMPEGPRSWFETQNMGEPFDSRYARAVSDDLAACQG